jgi:hypothetical protein
VKRQVGAENVPGPGSIQMGGILVRGCDWSGPRSVPKWWAVVGPSDVETFRGSAGPITPVECRDKKGLVDSNLVDLSLSIYPSPFVQGKVAALERRG